MTITVRFYAQIGDGGTLHPIADIEGEDEADVRAGAAACLRSLSAMVDTDAAFLETLLRYDEDNEDQ